MTNVPHSLRSSTGAFRGRDISRASLLQGGRQVSIELRGLPFGRAETTERGAGSAMQVIEHVPVCTTRFFGQRLYFHDALADNLFAYLPAVLVRSSGLVDELRFLG